MKRPKGNQKMNRQYNGQKNKQWPTKNYTEKIKQLEPH